MSPHLVVAGQQFEISEEVWEAWKGAADPFVDSPDSVLRRKFGIPASPDGSRAKSDWGAPATGRGPSPGMAGPRRTGRKDEPAKRRTRVASHLILPEVEYEVPILEALEETGGRRPTREVVVAVGNSLGDRLTEADRADLPNGGGPRWENRTQFARLKLVRDGLLIRDSPRGVWEISDAGRQRVALAREGAAR